MRTSVNKKAKMSIHFLLIWAMLQANPGLGVSLNPGLFDRRAVLEKTLADIQRGQSGPMPKTKGEIELKHELEVIDKQYSIFITTVSRNAATRNFAEVSRVCKLGERDPIGQQVCHLAYYVGGGRKNIKGFLDQFPITERGRQALWALDEIANRDEVRPELFRPDGPADSYISELFRIVQTGNTQALRAYMELYCHADGIYAEYMENELETLFCRHIEVVVRNWLEIKRCESALSNLRDELSINQKKAIVTNVQQYCSGNRPACQELTELFSR